MKKTVTVEKLFCDACEAREAFGYDACLRCGKVYCHDCAKTHVVEYPHAVSFSGSGDGHYCVSCDQTLQKECDSLHRAYRAVRALRHEQAGWYASFQERSKAAEAEVERQRQGRERLRG